MNISDVVTGWRKHNKLSIRKAAEVIGIDKNALFRMEQGKPVNQAALLQVWRWMLQ